MFGDFALGNEPIDYVIRMMLTFLMVFTVVTHKACTAVVKASTFTAVLEYLSMT